jgi:chromosome segregation ATPase
MNKFLGSLLVVMVLGLVACNKKSPEDLPKFKKKFRAQITNFEQQKDKADDQVNEGVEMLNGLQSALENAKNVDKEFADVYGKWNRVNKQVEDLNKEFEDLKQDADNLFSAMERQTASLNDAKTRNELTGALKTTRQDYEKTLANTSVAIEQLRGLHTEAVDVIKALEVAIALGQIAEINSGLQSIENKVASIMDELNATINESKDLYESRIGTI